MHRSLLVMSALTWVLFIWLLWVVFGKEPSIMLWVGVIPIGLFISGIVLLLKRSIN